MVLASALWLMRNSCNLFPFYDSLASSCTRNWNYILFKVAVLKRNPKCIMNLIVSDPELSLNMMHAWPFVNSRWQTTHMVSFHRVSCQKISQTFKCPSNLKCLLTSESRWERPQSRFIIHCTIMSDFRRSDNMAVSKMHENRC